MKKAIVIVLFLLAVAWYFFPVGIEFFRSPQTGKSLLFAMRLALPATLLALGGIGLLPWLMTAGFFFLRYLPTPLSVPPVRREGALRRRNASPKMAT